MSKYWIIRTLFFLFSFFPQAQSKQGCGGKTVKMQNLNVYYEIYGKGHPLVLLHGNGGSIQEFNKQIPELSKYFKVIAVDTRAQGKSTDFSTKDLTYKIFADDLKKLINHLKLKKVNILGWSDGGNTGLEFSLKYPQHLHKLIIIGANLFPQGIEDDLLETYKNKLLQLENNSENFNEIRLLKLMLNEPHIKKNTLQKIKNSVFVIAGEKDVIKREHTEMIAKKIPNTKLKIYKNSSHNVPFEVANKLNKDIIEFLKK